MLSGIEFEDARFAISEWPTMKPKTLWGSVPILELADGTRLGQARAVLRLVGKVKGLYPTDPLVAQRVDELMDALEDLGTTVTNVGQGLPKEEQEAATRPCRQEVEDGLAGAVRLAQQELVSAKE